MKKNEPSNHCLARFVVEVRQEVDDDTPHAENVREARRRYQEAGGGA